MEWKAMSNLKCIRNQKERKAMTNFKCIYFNFNELSIVNKMYTPYHEQ